MENMSAQFAHRDAIRKSLPWNASIDWCDDEPTIAMVLMDSPGNPLHGVRVSVANVEEARLLVGLTRNGGGMYHHMHVTGFRR